MKRFNKKGNSLYRIGEEYLINRNQNKNEIGEIIDILQNIRYQVINDKNKKIYNNIELERFRKLININDRCIVTLKKGSPKEYQGKILKINYNGYKIEYTINSESKTKDFGPNSVVPKTNPDRNKSFGPNINDRGFVFMKGNWILVTIQKIYDKDKYKVKFKDNFIKLVSKDKILKKEDHRITSVSAETLNNDEYKKWKIILDSLQKENYFLNDIINKKNQDEYCIRNDYVKNDIYNKKRFLEKSSVISGWRFYDDKSKTWIKIKDGPSDLLTKRKNDLFDEFKMCVGQIYKVKFDNQQEGQDQKYDTQLIENETGKTYYIRYFPKINNFYDKKILQQKYDTPPIKKNVEDL